MNYVNSEKKENVFHVVFHVMKYWFKPLTQRLSYFSLTSSRQRFGANFDNFDMRSFRFTNCCSDSKKNMRFLHLLHCTLPFTEISSPPQSKSTISIPLIIIKPKYLLSRRSICLTTWLNRSLPVAVFYKKKSFGNLSM